ncbi:hypothetical protein [Gordonia sp. NPDC003585]|uniref:hypothetical protein n=1 Tax=unclassified Gordonia (in: high G+C Gram-positive bacteria) TaxID=2657482 RepID=UPI0033BE1F0B
MAHHRSTGSGGGIRSRGVSRGLVFALLSIILVAAIIVAWQHLGDRIDREADEAAGSCVEGRETVTIRTDADLAPGLTEIAANYAKTNPVVRDHCVTVTIRPDADAKITADALAGTWDDASMGTYPAAWIPQSSVWAANLSAVKPTAIEGTPRSLVTSPVVLAVSPAFNQQLGGKLDWSQLPTLQRRDASLADVGLPGWGSLRMAMPTERQSDSSALAAQAVAAQVTRTTGALTTQDAASERVRFSVQALLEGAPLSPDGTPAGAARVIAEGSGDPSSTRIHAVPITEQKLYQETRNDAQARLAELLPTGPTPVADYPVVRLTDDRVSDVATDTVADFVEFAAQPDQLRLLTALGFRGDAPLPAATATVTFPRTPSPMPSPEPGAIVAINRLVYGPA